MTMPNRAPIVNNRIDAILSEHQMLMRHLERQGQILLMNRSEEAFSKTLIIAVASYFEVLFTEIIVQMFRDKTGGADPLAQFVRKQAIGRRFAQLFNWGSDGNPSRNANSFYNLFGPHFSTFMRDKIKSDHDLDRGVQAFIEIGNIRNHMVHGNFADFQCDKSIGDVRRLYEEATVFVDAFRDLVNEFIDASET